MAKNDLRLMVQASKMYFLEELTQSEIAERLFISRPQVSKLISAARESNIVNIQINDPFSEEVKVSTLLKERYHLSDVLVVDTDGLGNAEALELLARNMSVLVSGYVSNGNLIGVGAGYTLASCSAHTSIYNCKNLEFVPLIAGESSSGERWYANTNSGRFARRADGKYFVLNAPLIIRKKDVREEIQDNEAIKPIFDAYQRLDVILLGIGQTCAESTLGKCRISTTEIAKAYERGAKAIIGASFIDAGGNETLESLSEIFVGIKAHQIRNCKSVIGIAKDIEKVEAIRATLKGDYLSAFCTDMTTAKALLS